MIERQDLVLKNESGCSIVNTLDGGRMDDDYGWRMRHGVRR